MLGANDLIVKLDIDVRVFVPTCLRESVLVELFQSIHLLIDKVFYIFFSFTDDAALWETTYIYNVVAYSGN